MGNASRDVYTDHVRTLVRGFWSVVMRVLIDVTNVRHVPGNVRTDVNIVSVIGDVASYVSPVWNYAHGVANTTGVAGSAVNLVIDLDVINLAERNLSVATNVSAFVESHVQQIVEYATSRKSLNFCLVMKTSHMLDLFYLKIVESDALLNQKRWITTWIRRMIKAKS